MADKEERILISKYTPYCDFSDTYRISYHDGVDETCTICKLTHDDCTGQDKCKNKKFELDKNMTRQQAIEVMAKALCHRHCPEKVCTSCDEWEKYGTKEDAEAALNALLEGVKK